MIKLYVDVFTPGNGKTYEFQLDSTLTVAQAKARIIDEIHELESGNITLDPAGTVLCDLTTRMHLAEMESLKRAGVKSGHGLVLV